MSRRKLLLAPGHLLNEYQLADVAKRLQWYPARVTPATFDFLARCPSDPDRRNVFSCQRHVNRFYDPSENMDAYLLRRCKNTLLCPACCAIAYGRRQRHQLGRLGTVNPEVGRSGLLLPAAFHIIVTSPPVLRPFLHDAMWLDAFRRASWRAIASSFGYKTDRQFQQWKKTRGAFFNLHAFGETDFLRWSPHFDIVMAAVDADGNYLPEKWPVRFESTRDAFRQALRREIRPLLRRMRMDVRWQTDELIHLHHELEADKFHVDLYIGQDPDHPKQQLIEPRNVPAIVAYSCRPLFDASRARLVEERGVPHLEYTQQGARYRDLIEVREAYRRLLAVREALAGRQSHTATGILHGNEYHRTVAKYGREPVTERGGSSLQFVETYWQGPDGRFDPQHRIIRSRFEAQRRRNKEEPP